MKMKVLIVVCICSLIFSSSTIMATSNDDATSTINNETTSTSDIASSSETTIVSETSDMETISSSLDSTNHSSSNLTQESTSVLESTSDMNTNSSDDSTVILESTTQNLDSNESTVSSSSLSQESSESTTTSESLLDETTTGQQDFDIEDIYQKYLNCQNFEEVILLYQSLSQEECKALDEMIEKKVKRNSAVNYSQVAPLLNAVYGLGQSNKSRMQRVMSTSNSIDDNIVLNKSAKHLSDDEYQIKLESFVTSEIVTETVSDPNDILLILDQSVSMARDFDDNSLDNIYSEGGKYVTIYEFINSKQKALQQIASDFIIEIGNNNNDRVSIVQFGKNSSVVSDYSNFFGTNYTWDGEMIVNDGIVNKSKFDYIIGNYSNKGEPGSLVNLVLNLDIYPDSSSTNTELGILTANELLQNNLETIPADEKRKQAVILFTDGEATCSEDDVIAASKLIKDAGATFYTIGIYDGADPTNLLGANKMMNYVSSNYPEAKKLNKPGNIQNSGYFLSAKDADGLAEIFKKIETEISKPSLEIEHEMVMIDEISEYFELVDESTLSIEIVPCIGFENNEYLWGEKQIVDLNDTNQPLKYEVDYDNKSIKISGFDYSNQYVSKEAKSDGSYGSKIVAKFNVQVNDNFIGGDNIPTNTNQSGVYNDDEDDHNIVKPFEVPTVDIPVQFDLNYQDRSIYLGNSAVIAPIESLEELINGFNNQFVNVEFNIYNDKNGDGLVNESDEHIEEIQYVHGSKVGNELNDFRVELNQCTSYIVEYKVVAVNPITDIENTQNRVASAKPVSIHVSYPSVQVNDVYVDYGTPVNLRNDCTGGNLAYNKTSDGQITDVIIDTNSNQPLDYQGHLLDEYGYYLVDNNGNKLSSDTSTSEVENAFSSNLRPDGVIWKSCSHFSDLAMMPNFTSDYPPSVEFEYVNRYNETYTTTEYYNERTSENELFKISKIKLTSSDGRNKQTNYDIPSQYQKEFKVILNQYDLVIDKTVLDETELSQDIIFKITLAKKDEVEEIEVVMKAKDFEMNDENNYHSTKTIKGLYSGIPIKIQEEGTWNWRYNSIMYCFNTETSDAKNKTFIDTANKSASLLVIYGYDYLSPKDEADSDWNTVEDSFDLKRNDQRKCQPTKASSSQAELYISNRLSTDVNPWIGDFENIGNVYNPQIAEVNYE